MTDVLGVVVQKSSRLLNLAGQGSGGQACDPGNISTSPGLSILIGVVSLLASRDLYQTLWGSFIGFPLSKMPTELSVSGEKHFNRV